MSVFPAHRLLAIPELATATSLSRDSIPINVVNNRLLDSVASHIIDNA